MKVQSENKTVGINAINEFKPPTLVKITTFLKNGDRNVVSLYATPTMPGFCRFFDFNYIFFFC
jgi:hypothetical protein